MSQDRLERVLHVERGAPSQVLPVEGFQRSELAVPSRPDDKLPSNFFRPEATIQRSMKNERQEQVPDDKPMSAPSKQVRSIDVGRVVEIVGLAGIIVSLIFLGYELKRSNDIAETEAVATIYSMTNELGLAMAENPELSRVFRQALSDFESLSPEDRWTLYVLLEYLINVNEAAWKYYDKGIINQEEADFYAQSLCKLIGRHPSLVAAWQSNKQDRLPGFYDYIMGVCEL